MANWKLRQKSAIVRHWLQSTRGRLWPHEAVGHGHTEHDWYWLVRDFERGQTCYVGIKRDDLFHATPKRVVHALSANDVWAQWHSCDALFLTPTDTGFTLVPWTPPATDRWLKDRWGQYFVVVPIVRAAVAEGGEPAGLPRRMLTLVGNQSSHAGPHDTADAFALRDEELLSYVDGVRGYR